MAGLRIRIAAAMLATLAVSSVAAEAHGQASTVGPAAAEAAVIQLASQRAPLTIVLVGDSTVATEGGWGPGFCALVTPNVTCVDSAKNGRSTKSFLDEGLWQAALAQSPQYVLMQFGHNDQKPAPALHADAEGAYADNLRRFIRETRAQGEVPVVVTPLSRRNYRDGALIEGDGLGAYAAAAKRVAAEQGVAVVDLLALSRARLEPMTQAEADEFDATAHANAKAENGSGASGTPLPPDRTHLNRPGQAFYGRLVAQALVTVRPELLTDFVLAGPTTIEAGGAPGAADDAGAAMAAAVREQWPAAVIANQPKSGAWTYEAGVLLDGMAALGLATHNAADLAYVKAAVDRWVQPDGSIQIELGKPFQPALHTLDNLEPARAVLFVYDQTHEERYRKAAAYLFAQFAQQPRNAFGGYWHKQTYPNQMWLDGAYMAEPFRAAYAKQFGPATEFSDIAKQLLLMDEHMRAPGVAVGELLRHGWDASRTERWADPQTGLSQEVWARALGWYMAALVDTLPSLPAGSAERTELIAVLQHVATGVVVYQGADTGTWWDVLNRPGAPGNFREASASAMFSYALLKGVRLGYLAPAFRNNGLRAWTGVNREFVTRDGGRAVLHGTVKVSGLGGNPYRAGDYSYYVHEPVVDGDPKGVGAYLLAASEVARLHTDADAR